MYFGGLHNGRWILLSKYNRLISFVLNLNWAVVSDKMYCIYHSLYIKKKQRYTFQRDERLSYKHLRSFCVCF